MSTQDEAMRQMQGDRNVLIIEINQIEMVLEETVMPEFIQQILTDAVQERQNKLNTLDKVL